MNITTLKTLKRLMGAAEINDLRPYMSGLYLQDGCAIVASTTGMIVESINDPILWDSLGANNFIHLHNLPIISSLVTAAKKSEIKPDKYTHAFSRVEGYPFQNMVDTWDKMTNKERKFKFCVEYRDLCELIDALDPMEKGPKLVFFGLSDANEPMTITLNERKGLLMPCKVL